ncbi:MAG TPA: hypothetical protein QF753_09010 [Victivallales bacterium]|nr:hypothetical protein [Victivallales bacterium]
MKFISILIFLSMFFIQLSAFSEENIKSKVTEVTPDTIRTIIKKTGYNPLFNYGRIGKNIGYNAKVKIDDTTNHIFFRMNVEPLDGRKKVNSCDISLTVYKDNGEKAKIAAIKKFNEVAIGFITSYYEVVFKKKPPVKLTDAIKKGTNFHTYIKSHDLEISAYSTEFPYEYRKDLFIE